MNDVSASAPATPAAQVDHLALQEELAGWVRKHLAYAYGEPGAEPIPEEAVRRCIEIQRTLRRTNTGPAATKRKGGPRGAKKVVPLDSLADI